MKNISITYDFGGQCNKEIKKFNMLFFWKSTNTETVLN